ncbi:type IV toxin-antitoxin system AbiEi family antitoxin domain-containing protein [uncultured Hydrogenophaga sp.]|uniref:type IV toxin-antitoxin system AbiEi family antitoxin domain-containing protein n=1 Tax=uncultured Hydrogenophaga sp. TaxID=199683 RepID=UPI002582EDCD|nr:type IV toxin-antitoxin system AbiEi family antitoxin domain-containing protein [uncultured Hydrogenophaga sp.]
MLPSDTDRLLELAASRRLLRGADARDIGVSPQLLIKLQQAGRLVRVARGVYSLPDAPLTEHQSLVEVCRRVPKAVICLLSALRFHELGSQAPHEVWLALPEGVRSPSVDYPALRIVRLRDAAYSEGIETVMDEGAPIRVYGVDKTIADCFKFRHKIGLDVALEALKDAWQRRLVSMDELTHFARINRVERVMLSYLEALTA